MTKKLLPFITSHHTYVEAFGGGASLLFARPPSPVEVYNDFDHALYEFFMTLSDPRAFARFYRRVAPLPYSRELYNECRATWREQETRHERVWRWFVVARQSFGGRFGASWGFNVTLSNRGMAKTVSGWLSILDRLPQIHARLQRVQIENRDWRFILDTYDTPETFFYLDPPYVTSTRRAGGYAHEMTDDDHAELVDTLLGLHGAVMLSGYAHPVYDRLTEAGWQRIDWETVCFAAGRTRATGIQGEGSARKKQARTETVYLSHPAQRRLL